MKNVNKKFDGTTVRVTCTVAYPHVFAPVKKNDSDKAKYSACILIDKNDTQAVQLINEAVEGAKVLYKEQFGAPKGRLKTVVHDGDEDRPDDDNFAGKLYINASSNRKPGVKMIEAGMLVDCLDEDEFYSGVKGAAGLRFYPYNNAGNTGISCNLDNLLKLEDGDRIGGGSMSADQAFADLV